MNTPIIIVLLTIFSSFYGVAGQQQDPTTMNGGSILAMAGRECVAVAVDKRFGSGPQMVTLAPRQVLLPHSHLMVAFSGLEGDVQTLCQELDLQVQSKLSRSLGFSVDDTVSDTSATTTIDGNEKEEQNESKGLQLSKQRDVKRISPRAMASLTSHVLYNRRNSPYYVEPLVVGLMKEESSMIPFLCGMDMIGAKSHSKAFVVGGTASHSLYGTAEALWRPNMEPEALARICGLAFQSALERDCLSGYGTIVYVLTKNDGVLQFEFHNRND